MTDSQDIVAMDQALNKLELLAQQPAQWSTFWDTFFSSIFQWTGIRSAALLSLHQSVNADFSAKENHSSPNVSQPIVTEWFTSSHSQLLCGSAEIAIALQPFLTSRPQVADSTDHDWRDVNTLAMVTIGQDKQRFAVGLFLRAPWPQKFVVWLECLAPANSPGDRQRRDEFLVSHEPFLLAMIEIACTFLFHDKRRREQECQTQLPILIGEINRASSLNELNACLAHDLPSWLDAERVAIVQADVQADGTAPKLKSLTGVDAIEQRTSPIRDLEHIAKIILPQKSPIFLHDCSQASNYGFALPLSHGAVLIAQWRTATQMLEGSSRLDSILGFLVHARGRCEHIPTPFATLNTIPNLWNRMSTRWRLLAAMFVLAVVGGLVNLPVRFAIEASGFVEPVQQKIVFAPEDGFVEQLTVDTGSEIPRDTTLLQLKSPELELRQQSIAGEWDDATQRRTALNVAINQSPAGDSRLQTLSQQWSAEVAGLDARILSLEEQQRILTQQHHLLTLTSPINGVVITPDLKKRLENRPVLRGDQLLRIADISGEWRLRLLVHEQDLGHVRSAWEANKQHSLVQFRLQSAPQITHTGAITRIASSATREPGQPPTVSVEVELASGALQVEQVGATVRGIIDCGQRPLWYVWTRELTESLMRNFWINTPVQQAVNRPSSLDP